MRSERQARILAMQALCQWEVQQADSSESLRELAELLEAPPEAVDLAVKLFYAYLAQRTRIDEQIAAAADKWDLSRISPVERNIMRVALAELITASAPPKVAINEAVEIGREFGGADSPRFINGLLDHVYQGMTKSET